MSHVFTGLTRRTISSGTSTFIRHINSSMRSQLRVIYPLVSFIRNGQSVRLLSVNYHLRAKRNEPVQEEVNDEPIRFSTSKASHRTWTVQRSLGSQYERPWWKVLPITVLGVSFLLWCAFREETDIDVQLEKELYQHLPGLLSDEEDDEKE
ncbi:ubiquinol-cytochrome-c reductase complex assembly factor 4 [Corythoichthys intestinalis]|uniref:ubiquinol-cytochrome-c reductase complex assembly factor 4 n=1 Tax=Corythoichthys intestinalis TaxID=161448 RepID=UPI0025A5E2F1|nr:ubiquinol-cytochrome-c reductase complex assembly factor 4 [Corythoichthys intestinalis]